MANDAQMPERIWAFKVNCGDVYTTEWTLNEGDAKADRDSFDHAEYLRRDLCASGQQVRALEWEESGPDWFFGKGECGDYSIATSASRFHEGEFRLCGVEGDFRYFDTAEAAKAAAQADYLRRVKDPLTGLSKLVMGEEGRWRLDVVEADEYWMEGNEIE